MQQLRRVLLKISGEALASGQSFGIDYHFLQEITEEIGKISASGIQIVLVVGGGNFFRGISTESQTTLSRTSGDFMGILGTIQNGIALRDAFNSQGYASLLLSGLAIEGCVEKFSLLKGITALEENKIVICAGGIGNPYFTTDTTAVLRALELQCDMVIKATKVDGVYTKDPVKFPDAEFIKEATYEQVLAQDLRVMDMTAISLAKEGKMKLQIINLTDTKNLSLFFGGADIGTTISA